jgi:hypothetical protein
MTWLLKLLEAMSPEIVVAFKEMIRAGLQALYEKALETENEWDDLGVKTMAKVFGVELQEPTDPA